MQKIIIPIISLIAANIAIKDTVVKSWIGKPYTTRLFSNELVISRLSCTQTVSRLRIGATKIHQQTATLLISLFRPSGINISFKI